MAIHLLSERTLKTAVAQNTPYTLRDGGSLYFQVQPSGNKLWRYRYRIEGRGYIFAIGRYPDLSLQQARQERDRARALVQRGIHPLTERRQRLAAQYQANKYTFEFAAEEWMAHNSQWSAGYVKKVQSYFRRDVYPALGKLPLCSIQAAHLRPVILAVASRGAKTAAILVRQWLAQVFSFSQTHGYCDHHPALGFRGLIRRQAIRHHPPLGWSDIPVFYKKLDAWAGHKQTKLAIRLLALTFVRPGELRQARWEEFDLQAELWETPQERMKMRRPHIVPLSRQAIALLEELRAHTGACPFLLPNLHQPERGAMGRSSLNRAIGCLEYAGRFSAHGFRATATTLLGLLGYPDKQVDLQLAHRKQDGSRVPYDQARFLSSRRLLMQDWADILQRLEGGATLAEVTQQFGPTSSRRTALMAVVERE